MDSLKNNTTWITFLCTGIAVGLFALGYYTDPILLVIASLFIPMVFVFLYARQTVWTLVLCLVGFGALVWLMAGMRYAVTSVACILPIALLTGYAMRRKTTFYFTTLASCAGMLVALGVLILCVFVFWQDSLSGVLLKHVEAQLIANPETAKLYYFVLGVVQGGGTYDIASLNLSEIMAVPAQTAVNGVMRSVTPTVLLYLPQLCTSTVALFGLLNYIMPRSVLKKWDISVGHVPTFSMWSLPQRFGTWSLVLLVISFIGVMASWNNFDLVNSIVMGFLSVTYTIQGMAFVDWLLKKKLDSRGARVALIVVIFLLLSLLGVGALYMWIGFFEQIVKMRKREQMNKV